MQINTDKIIQVNAKIEQKKEEIKNINNQINELEKEKEIQNNEVIYSDLLIKELCEKYGSEGEEIFKEMYPEEAKEIFK